MTRVNARLLTEILDALGLTMTSRALRFLRDVDGRYVLDAAGGLDDSRLANAIRAASVRNSWVEPKVGDTVLIHATRLGAPAPIKATIASIKPDGEMALRIDG